VAGGNAVLESVLHRLLPEGTSEQQVDRLALPFRCVASDLLTGELVEFRDTPLFLSMRASLAMPGVFAPVRVNRRLMVDGGLVRNLPVDIARSMGADLVIAVNVGTPLSPEAALDSSFGVASQMLHILTEQNVKRSLDELRPADVLITPDLEGISFMDFNRAEVAMAAGTAAVERLAGRLARFAVSPEDYAAREAVRTGHRAAPDEARVLARLEIAPTAHASRAALAAHFGLREGDAVTAAQLDQAAARLFGHGDFERIEMDRREVAGQRDVTVRPVEADWARSRLRLGLELSSDLEDDHRFNVSALHVLSWLNRWGAELRTLVHVGSLRSISTQVWQPLGPGSPWFVTPGLEYRASSLDGFENGRRTIRAGYRVSTAGVAIGRELSTWGNVQLGIDRRVGFARSLLVAEGDAVEAKLGETARYLQYQVDTLDTLALPGRGLLLQGRTERARRGDEPGVRATSSLLLLKAFRVGDWASHGLIEWSKSGRGQAPLTLGGFLRLSGTPRESIGASRVLLGRLVMARRIAEMPAGLGGAVRAGVSLELGATYEADRSARFDDARRAGSAFMSVDTRFGPVFLAYGATRGVGRSAYLFLGPFW
jgi:NTE family protein